MPPDPKPSPQDELLSQIKSLVTTQTETNKLLTLLVNNGIDQNKLLMARIDAQGRGTASQLQTIANGQQLQANSLQSLLEWHGLELEWRKNMESLTQAILDKKYEVLFPSLNDTNALLQKMLDIMLSEVEEGVSLYKSDTATTALTVLYLTTKDEPHHAVKGVLIKNDGAYTIRVATNKNDSDSYFMDIKPKELVPIMMKSNVIERVYIKTDSGSSAYRRWLVW